jgi:hypothetical protein
VSHHLLRQKPELLAKKHVCEMRIRILGTERAKNRVTFGARLQLGSSFAGLQIPYARKEGLRLL